MHSSHAAMEDKACFPLCFSFKAFVTVGKVLWGERPKRCHAARVFHCCWNFRFYSKICGKYITPTVRFNQKWVSSTTPGQALSVLHASWASQCSVLAAASQAHDSMRVMVRWTDGGIAKKVSSHATSIGNCNYTRLHLETMILARSYHLLRLRSLIRKSIWRCIFFFAWRLGFENCVATLACQRSSRCILGLGKLQSIWDLH